MIDIPKQQGPARQPVRDSRRHSWQATIEDHIIVLLIGAALGSWFTYRLTGQQTAKTQAAVQGALRAATPDAPAAAIASVPK